VTRVVAVAAAASGIGRANARAYADAGWDVALLGQGWAGLEAAAADVRDRGRDALVLPIDLTDDAARELAVERIRAELGPIDAWVPDGAIPRFDPRPRSVKRPARSGSLRVFGGVRAVPPAARAGLAAGLAAAWLLAAAYLVRSRSYSRAAQR
jgi:NAD(P)-dependent dehydrogenase (short-subunit alcohol dehydrogenase family)